MDCMTCLTCFSDGFLPIWLIMALIMFSLIGGFFSKYFWKYLLEMKKPATAPTKSAATINTMANHNSIIISLLIFDKTIVSNYSVLCKIFYSPFIKKNELVIYKTGDDC